MDDRTPGQIELSAGEPTLDCDPKRRGPSLSEDTSLGGGACCGVALVEGSGPELTRETHELLRKRLRLAAVLLFFTYLVFLPQHYAQADFSLPGSTFLFVFHAAATLVMGALGGLLCHRCQISMFRLQLTELGTFGLSAAFLVALQHYIILHRCCELTRIREVVEGELYQPTLPAGPWLVLIFTYALFVPNTRRRAAVIIGLLAATPVAMVAVMTWVHEQVGQILSLSGLTGFTLVIVVTAVIGVFGVDTIGSLRREVFEARQLGHYRLTRRIGAGGMGEVYLAEHQLMKRPCVVKLIRPDKAGDAKVLARFQREVRATAKLTHWNTVEIFDYGSTDDGTFYYVMEYLPGMSLWELVERFGPMPPQRVVHLLRQACDALSEAHAMGLIHRDIKPGNIFAAQRGGVYDVAKLLDFGLVKPLVEEQSVHLTTEGAITGSPLFMSPEQAVGDDHADARSDIYSLGAVAYYLLTGRPPFEGEKALKVMIAHAREEVVAPSRRQAGIPSDLERVVLRCLAKAPSDRFQSAAELADALAACQSADGWSRSDAAAWWQQQEQEVPV